MKQIRILFFIIFLFSSGSLRAYEKFCDLIAPIYKSNSWGSFHCPQAPAKIMGFSVLGRPLVYFEYGNPKGSMVTVIQCGIHGDELPSLPMCMKLIGEIETKKREVPNETHLYIQPLLNPDGMLAKNPQRQNARGVDINRNFPTDDWTKEALISWKIKDRQDPRKYPGSSSNSEPETQAIVRFVERVKPQKILSIHTPLGFLDLDSHGSKDQQRRAKYLAVNMSKNSGNFRFIRFGFYPGSLGNFAGRMREIPTYTLELPEGISKPTVDNYWERFRIALWRAIDFDLATGTFVED